MQIDNAIEAILREQTLRLAVSYEHATVGIAEIDPHGTRLRVNATACAITGWVARLRPPYKLRHRDERIDQSAPHFELDRF